MLHERTFSFPVLEPEGCWLSRRLGSSSPTAPCPRPSACTARSVFLCSDVLVCVCRGLVLPRVLPSGHAWLAWGHCSFSGGKGWLLVRTLLCPVPDSTFISSPAVAFPNCSSSNARPSSFSNFPCIVFEIDPIKFLSCSMSPPALKAKAIVVSCCSGSCTLIAFVCP